MSKRFRLTGQPTKARHYFTPKLYGVMRTVGLQAYTKRWQVWMEGTDGAYFDLSRESEVARFKRWATGVMNEARIERYFRQVER